MYRPSNSQKRNRKIIVFAAIFVAGFFTLFLIFYEPSSSHQEVTSASKNNDKNIQDGGSAASSIISKIEFAEDDKKFLLNFLLKEGIISRAKSNNNLGDQSDEAVFCLDLVNTDSNNKNMFEQLRNLNCENSLKSSLEMIRHHHDQFNNNDNKEYENNKKPTKISASKFLETEFYDKAGSVSIDIVKLSSTSSTSLKPKVLSREKFHSQSKNMKSLAISTFVAGGSAASTKTRTYEQSLISALQKIHTNEDELADEEDEEKLNPDFGLEKRHEVVEFSRALDQLLLGKNKNNKQNQKQGATKYFSSASYFAALTKVHFVFRISPSSSSSSSSSSLSENEVHGLRDFMLTYDEQVLSHLVKYQKQHHSRLSTNFIFVGLDDENLVKEVLKIFFTLIQDEKDGDGKNNDYTCKIISSSNDAKNTKNRNQDIVVVHCGSSSNHEHHQISNNEKNPLPFDKIDPMNFCTSLFQNKNIQLASKALKLGKKTGVYLGKYSSSSTSSSENHKNQLMLVKHYNILQYVHGFGSLHTFLSSKISFQHPAIVMPTAACIMTTRDDGAAASSIASSSSLSVTENVLQFQPLIKKQKSLTTFMELVRKNKHKNKNNNHQNGAGEKSLSSFTWKDKLDISLQLLCIFSFLHSHHRGPFSFDDNHPDQYLIVENFKNNNNNNDHKNNNNSKNVKKQENDEDQDDDNPQISNSYATGARYLLKMVDIDTLQTAKKFKKSNDNDDNDERIIPPLEGQQQEIMNAVKKTGEEYFYTSHVLKCRCFYCRGKSNCLFANSYEGYRSCGQHVTKDRGDEGNRENTKYLAEKMAKRKKSKSDENDDDGEIRECTLLTDSWYLGQLLFLIGSDGELLFPYEMTMKETIEAIDFAVEVAKKKNTEKSTAGKLQAHKHLEEYFPHINTFGILNKNDNSDESDKFIAEIFFDVVQELLIGRIEPGFAAVKLMSSLRIDNALGLDNWCPDEHFTQFNKELHKKKLFEGLKIV